VSESRKLHWEHAYSSKDPTEVSWYQGAPQLSLQMIAATGVETGGAIIDVGGGASTLVDNLLDNGYSDVTVLDIASAALDQSRARLGDAAKNVTWIEQDILHFEPNRSFILWHDRSVFHFLTEKSQQRHYVDLLQKAIEPGGHVILATFGPDGPQRCSGLPVQRYSTEELSSLLEPAFELRTQDLEEHKTPGGSAQQFLYTCWQARV
jgi:SAM-dependent methyltransferase